MPTVESRFAGRESRPADGDTRGAGTSFSFYHAMLSQDVCPSVCLSHGRILSKRLNIYITHFHYRVATPFCFSVPNGMAIF